MHRRTALLSLTFATAVMFSGCDSEPTAHQTPQYRPAESSPRDTPTPRPTRTVASAGFDRSLIPEYYSVTFSSPYWVQLDDRRAPMSCIVVGIEPSRSGQDLDAEVEMQRLEMDNPPSSKYLEAGTIDSKALGTMRWTSSVYRMEDTEIQQLAVFGAHPADGCLVIARSEFPASREPMQPKLDELVAITEIIGPGL